jgi:hypothetical protein
MGFGSLIAKVRLDKASRIHSSESDRRGLKVILYNALQNKNLYTGSVGQEKGILIRGTL